EITGLGYFGYSETREYTPNLQLKKQEVTGVMNMEYVYTAGAHNGRITSSVDHILNETVNYSYDNLNRLAAAQTAGTGGWGQGFAYDGFGNLTGKTALKGSVPTLSVAFDGTTNRVLGGSYDANGNPAGAMYDVENRKVYEGVYDVYAYDHAGKRVMHEYYPSTREYSVYGIGG